VVGGADWEQFGGIWDTATGERVATLGGQITSARFSPDGRLLVTGSYDGSARIWDPVSGAPLAVLPHAGNFGDAAFVRGGSAVATVGGRKLKIFSCAACWPLDRLVALARHRVSRSLTPGEAARYVGGAG
jgi:WD40 repeat protein